ncbi:hypothetical protein P691DRAFT_767187 [Macrolepiota fuliginosa MF-IS2]|uniref:Uncharacterized protein n=1 Tax=Macrolepiota fuliginosa MF-IS2 TaxID=1400762 RepID=A0A9P6BUW6_9AGAR|nr:hypothetical protein P691DRAFT_767187 [Macrolepiota fuliginosa MF-IS2]
MPCKAKDKPMTNATPTYKPSAATERFLTTMDQNCRIASQFTTHELIRIRGFNLREIKDDLFKMNFTEVDASTCDNSIAIKINNDNNALFYDEELSPAEELTNAIAAFRQWFEGNNISDKEHPGLIDNIRHIAMMFSLIPVPHHCPIPSPCTHPHQDNALPCQHLHTDDIPPSPPCARPHCNDEDTPMEPSAPTCAFSKVALQTPAPSYKATMPPPPPTTAATSPAAAASSVSAGPSPPFVHGPPHAPAAILAQNPQPILSKCSKQPFFATCRPTHRQFYIEAPNIPSDTSLPSLVNTANHALTHAKSTLKVDSAHISPHGITCVTASVPSTSDLDIIKATLSGRLLGACISIPASRSFIKIMDVPFFKSSTMDPFTSTEVDTQLQRSIIPADFVVHWCYVCNSPKADSATIWINLSNSQ